MSDRPIFHITARTYVHTVWFVGGHGWDMLGMVMREGKGAWRGVWRMRFDGEDDQPDERRVHTLRPRPGMTGDDFATVLDQVFRGAAQAISTDVSVETLPVGGGPEELKRVLLARPWAHVMGWRPAPKVEA